MAGRNGSAPGERRGGREKGTPNKRTWDLVQKLEELGFDPAAKLIQLTLDAEAEYARSKEIHDRIQENRDDADIKGYFADTGPAYLGIASRNCADLLKFVYPQRKAVDVTSGGQNVFQSFSDVVKKVVAQSNDDASGASNDPKISGEP